jgi:hypothetical protein
LANAANMKNIKKLGIWMDHSSAYLMEIVNDKIVINRVVSELSNPKEEFNFYAGEKLVHKKEHHLQLNFYNKISDFIRKFQNVVLFGPTNAKNELFNLLKTNHLFKGIKIEVRDTDRMTEDRMQVFTREYFK